MKDHIDMIQTNFLIGKYLNICCYPNICHTLVCKCFKLINDNCDNVSDDPVFLIYLVLIENPGITFLTKIFDNIE